MKKNYLFSCDHIWWKYGKQRELKIIKETKILQFCINILEEKYKKIIFNFTGK